MFLIEMFINHLFFNFFMKWVIILALFFILIISGCEGVQESPERINVNEKSIEPEYITLPENAPKYQEGIIHIKFKEGSDVVYEEEAIDFVNNIKENNFQLSDVVEVKKVFMAKPSTKNYEIKKQIGLDRWVEISFPKGVRVDEEILLWEKIPSVEKTDLVPIYYPTVVPNDPQFDYQWYHYNMGDHIHGLPTTPDADIDSVEAWDIETGEVLVANLEPIQWYHEDIVDNVWQNLNEDADQDGHVLEWDSELSRYVFDSGDMDNQDGTFWNNYTDNGYADDFIGWDFANNDNDPYIPGDDHGLKTAGAFLAKSDNNIGVAGVCWNCRLVLAGRVFPSSQMFEYVIDNGVRVISMSFLGLFSMGDALQYAHTMGVVVLASSGNSGEEDENLFCENENVICVSGSTVFDEQMFSYGNTIDVAAPGDHIRTTFPDNIYGWTWGTSFSAPITAGVAGLVLTKNPNLSPNEILSLIQSSTDQFVNPDKYSGNGRLNAHTALQLTEESLIYGSFPVAMINAVETEISDTNLEIYGTANSPDFIDYQILYGEGFYPTSWDILTQETTPVERGLLYSFDLSQLYPNNYQIKLVVTDTNGQSAIDSYHLSFFNSPFGWPQLTGGDVRSSPALGDIDNDNELEIVVGSNDNSVYVWNGDGTIAPGWPQSTDGEVRSSPALGDIDNDNELEIIVASYDGSVYAWNGDGSFVPGWPILVEGGFIYSSPALGDIDGDGELEIVIGTYGVSPSVYAWNGDGTIAPGWPIFIGNWVISSPALGDIDNDGELEIVVGSNDNSVYVWNGDGTIAPGWPKLTGGDVRSSPALGDIDNDNELEIVVGSNDNSVYVWNGDGTIVSGWPQQTGDFLYSSPALGDIDGDDELEIVVGSNDNSVYVWKTEMPYNSEKMDWPMFRHDVQRTGNYNFGEIIEDISNKVKNPSFEIDAGIDYYPDWDLDDKIPNNSIPDGWHYWDGGQAEGVMDSQEFFLGNNSFKIDLPEIVEEDRNALYQDVPVVYKNKYKVSGYVKTNCLDENCYGTILTTCRDEDHNQIYGCGFNTPENQIERIFGNSDWTKIEYTLEGDNIDADYIRVYCYHTPWNSEYPNPGAGTILCDDFKVEEISKPEEELPDIATTRQLLQPKEIQEQLELEKKTKELPKSKQRLSPLQGFWDKLLEILF